MPGRGMMNVLVVLLDGAPEPGESAYARARTPALDALARTSLCGIWPGPSPPQGYNIKSLSEPGMLGIFGYAPGESPGRGFLEALGLGIQPRAGAVYLRANFATLEGGRITDRRAGRDETSLGEIARDLETRLEGVSCRLVKGKGHRGVLVLEGEGLSSRVSDGDSGAAAPARVQALEPGAERTAAVLNRYLDWSQGVMASHAANRKRRVPANCLLVRSAGMQRPVQPFSERFGVQAGAVGNDTVFNGIASYLGMEVARTGEQAAVEDNLEAKLGMALGLLGRKDIVFLHLKGPDIFGHDRDLGGKARFIEEIDAKVFAMIPGGIGVAVISDHATSSATGEHCLGDIPFLVHGNGWNGASRFTEEECRKGFREDSPMKRILPLVSE